MLVKTSVAGTIVANTLLVLGASFLLGGLRHHLQEYNRVNARFQAGLLFLATIRAICCAGSCAAQLCARAEAYGLAVLARRRGDDADRHHRGGSGHQQRSIRRGLSGCPS